MNSFSLNAALNFGIETLKRNLGKILLFELGYFIYSIVISSIETGLEEMYGIAAAIPIYAVDILLVSSVVTLGVIKVTLLYLDGKVVIFEDLWTSLNTLFVFVLSTFVAILLIVTGSIFLIIPGVIIAIRLQFADFFIVEGSAGPIEALRLSFELTRGKTWDLFLFDMLLFFGTIAGFFFFFVGIALTAPVAYLAMTSVYRQLRANQVLSEPLETSI